MSNEFLESKLLPFLVGENKDVRKGVLRRNDKEPSMHSNASPNSNLFLGEKARLLRCTKENINHRYKYQASSKDGILLVRV